MIDSASGPDARADACAALEPETGSSSSAVVSSPPGMPFMVLVRYSFDDGGHSRGFRTATTPVRFRLGDGHKSDNNTVSRHSRAAASVGLLRRAVTRGSR